MDSVRRNAYIFRVEGIYVERWRLFGLTTLLVVLFLTCLFLVAEAGRTRMLAAAEAMQHTMSRQILLGQLREGIAESALAYRSFLLTGRAEMVEPLRDAGTRINATADSLVASYRGEPSSVADSAHQLRYLAGIETGAMMTTMQVYATQGAGAALDLARTREVQYDPLGRVLEVANQLKRYESARMRESRANWDRETLVVQRLAAIATIANILLVASAMLMAHATYRRHREAMQQVAQRRDELELEATARATELSDVYGRLQSVQEQERSRLARGLHDELGGLLLAARMDVSWLLRHLSDSSSENRAARLRRIQEVLDQGIDLKRRVIEELRPTLLDNMGLVAALRWQMEETCGRCGLQCSSHFPDEEPVIAPEAAIALFRVAQEALTNVVKHSDARHVEVTLETSGTHVLLVIADDGRGLRPGDLNKPQAHGLAGMKHRAAAVGGTLHVGQSPNGGTEVRVFVPRVGRSEHAA
jgi:signal transduction histidine kinase